VSKFVVKEGKHRTQHLLPVAWPNWLKSRPKVIAVYS